MTKKFLRPGEIYFLESTDLKVKMNKLEKYIAELEQEIKKLKEKFYLERTNRGSMRDGIC